VWDGGLAAQHGNRQWAFSLAMDPGNPDRLYMGQSYAILRSTDGGRTWRYVFGDEYNWGGGIKSIVVSPDRSGRVWAAGTTAFFAAAVFRSDDWGDTWRVYWPTQNADDMALVLVVNPSNPNQLWAGVAGGVKRSDDAGETWQMVLITPRIGVVGGLTLVGDTLYAASVEWEEFDSPVTMLGLYRSLDQGASWDTLSVPEGALGATDLVVDRHGGLLIPTHSGVWRVRP
jgi:photosystem II stability/assembly factor-like uncharacterized protein